MFHCFERQILIVFVHSPSLLEDSSVDLRVPSSRAPVSTRATLRRVQARPLVGRHVELQQLVAAVRSAASQQGSLWFVSGEPGIGKSRLSEELSDCAQAEGALVVWGRCWEAGGAPAYWPWIQVLRALLRDDADLARVTRALGQRARHLVHLLPELDTRLGREARSPSLECERFELLDALCGVLCDAPRDRPIVLVLEDLHMADRSSLEVFEVLGPQLKNSSICIVGTLRDGEACLVQTRDALMAALARGRTLPLTRLAPSEVESFLTACLGHPPKRDACDAIYEATEGNPLFLTEVTRLLTTTEGWDRLRTSGVAIPGNVRHTLRRRLETLSDVTLAGARVAAVLGREFSGSMLSALWGRSMGDTAEPLHEAMDAGVLVESAPGEYRFSHVLLREVLHQDLVDSERVRLHLEAAELLRHRRGGAAVWSEIANHYLEAGAVDRSGTVEACRRAARQAYGKLAFFDARQWTTRALTALGQDESADLAERAELLLELADAELCDGAIEKGKRTCERVAELARALGAPELLGRAALTYGSVLVIASVDARLEELLSEALAALDPAESPLRAILTARLAAARQPAADPEPPIRMAQEAVAMARRLSDQKTWLEVARYAVSAMMDLGSPSERAALNREYIRVAERLGRPLEVLRGQMRLVFDSFELGDLAGAEATIQAMHVRAHALRHPFFAWRARAFLAMSALYKGSFDEAERHIDAARALGERARDPNVARATVMQRFTLLSMRGQHQEALALGPEVTRTHQGLELADILSRLQLGALRLEQGQDADHGLVFAADEIDVIFSLADLSMMGPLLDLARVRQDRELLLRLYQALQKKEARFVSGGMLLMTWMEPVALLLARCVLALGQREQAEHQFQAAIQAAEATGGKPFAAKARLEYAEMLLSQGGGRRAQELFEGALAIAGALGMEATAARARRGLEELAKGDRGPDTLGPVILEDHPSPKPTLVRDGEFYELGVGEKVLRLRDTKGVQWLHELMLREGEPVHVLELVAPSGPGDGGDAGEHLDSRAVSEYRQRVVHLTQELEEAEAFRDSGRALKAQTELEFIRHELSRAVGIGNRTRRAGSAQERARINVQRRLRDAIRRIASLDAQLGHYFQRSVTTGLFCSYRP